MNRKLYSNVNLSCLMQQDSDITTDKCHTGIISRNSSGFRFEEAIRKGRPARNPKLYDGSYVSMVRKRDGRYQLHLKTMTDRLDRGKYAFGVYTEIINALKIMD